MLSQQLSSGNNSNIKTILILAANPKSTSRLRLDEEVREIDEGLRRASLREQFRLEQKWAVRQRDFYRAILDYQPQIIHFSGHGAGVDGIVLEDETEQLVEVNALALASMFKLFATKGVVCVLLNACYSEVQAKAIGQHVKYVIGMNKAVGDKAAIAFSVAFYDALAAGEQMEFAYELGCSVLINYLEQQTPVLYKKDETSIISVQLKEDIIPPNPYQGLAAFGEEDAAFFFGREAFVNGLVEAVNKQPLVAVIGPSGSGKSSVVYAGLIPQLRMTGNWLIESFRPGNKPFYQLASALVRQLVPEVDEIQQLRSAAGLDKDIQQGSVTLQQITSRIIERNPGKRLLLFVDQFEELYTLCPKEEQERFADLMLQAMHQENLTLVFTLRADFYGFVLAYRPLRDALQQFTSQLLSAMNREELLRAIEQPAQKIEVQLEAQLARRILDDVGNEPGNLPLLEFALTRLWSLQQNRTLTHQAYLEIGGVKKALANHAEQVYQKLSETEQKIAQRIFVQLVRPGEGTEDTRRIATRAEVGDENWGLVSDLAGYTSRLVVTGHDEKSGEDTVEVVHEALIREWLTLREWMKKDRLFRAWQERLRNIIHQWSETKQDEGVLLRGVPLSEAEEKLKQRREQLTPSEQNFIQLSIEQRDRLHQQEEERKQRELETEIRVRKAAQTRSRVTVGASVIVLGFAFFAGYQWQQADKRRVNAEVSVQSFTIENLFASGSELEALLSGLKAGKKLKQYGNTIEADNRIKAVVALEQIINGLKEHNRLEGHSDKVESVAFSPDGKTIASGSADNTVKLWNQSGQLLKTLKGHRDEVLSVAFSPDGKTIASGSADNTVKLWNQSGQLLKTLKGHSDEVYSVAFSPDGKTIASGSRDSTVKLWNQSGQLLKTLKGHSDTVYSVAFSPDGKTIASGSADNTVKLWNQSGQLLKTLKGHSDKVYSVAFSPDGKTIASGSTDNTVKLWNQSGQLLNTLKGHRDEVDSVAFSPDGKTIASGSRDSTVKLWNQSGQLLNTLKGHSNTVYSVAFSPDGKTIASGSGDHTVKLWNQSGQLLNTLKGHSNTVYSVAFSPDGKTIASGSGDHTVKLWNQSGQLLKTLKGHRDEVLSVAFSPDGKTIASGSADNTVKLWNQSGQLLKTLKGHRDEVLSVAFSPDGKTIASGSRDSTVKLWNQSGQLLKTLKGHSDEVESVAFSPDGKTIASGSYDNTVKLWNQSGQLLNTLKGHSDKVESVAFSPDGKTIASGSDDNTAKLWNQSGQLLNTLKGHSDTVLSVAFSPNGKTIVSGSRDNTIKLWNQSGQLLNTLKGHSDIVLSVAFSPDGKTIVSGSDDHTVKLWNLNLDDLLTRGCAWISDYLNNDPNVKNDDRHFCDDIAKIK